MRSSSSSKNLLELWVVEEDKGAKVDAGVEEVLIGENERPGMEEEAPKLKMVSSLPKLAGAKLRPSGLGGATVVEDMVLPRGCF